MIIEESIHVAFDETNPIRPRKEILDDITNSLEDIHIDEKGHKGKGNGNEEDFQIDENKKKKYRSSKRVENFKISSVTSQKGILSRYAK